MHNKWEICYVVRLTPEVLNLGKSISESINKVVLGSVASGKDPTDEEVAKTIINYEMKYQLPTTDSLKYGCNKLVKQIYQVFPELIEEPTQGQLIEVIDSVA